MAGRVLALCCLVVSVALAQTLKTYNIDTSSFTTSGISSGAFMATQMHVAYSASFKTGSGIIAGGPYYCAKGSMTTATTSCMTIPSGIVVSTLVSDTNKFFSAGDIDDPNNMASSKVYMYSGTKDTVVNSGVVEKLKDYYSTWIPDTNINFKNDIASQHAWITDDFGSTCNMLKSPYINNCNYDAAGVILTWLYGNLNPAGTYNANNLIKFDQTSYCPSSPKSISFNTVGYVYVPTSCANGATCKLMVSFHGCQQTIADIGTDFVVHSGLNEWAETNDIIVLYPQAIKSTMSPSNPEGCFDWWGYTNKDYAKKAGPQMTATYNMVKALAGL